MVTKKVFGLYSKLVKRSVWQNFLLSRIYDIEVFQKSFSIHSLQNFVVDNQMSKYSAEKTSPLTFFFVLTFFRSYFMAGKERLRNGFSRQI